MIKIHSNFIDIYFDFSAASLSDLFLVIKSYTSSHEYLIKWIYLVDNEEINKYINITAIIKFNYIEFKMWWFNVENKIGYLSNSKIYNFYEEKKFFIRIETLSNNPIKFPSYPWSKKLKKDFL